MNSFGRYFRITTFGESHGPAIGVVVDGCPPRLDLDVAEIQRELDRRRPGQSRLVSQRREADRATILSGVFEGRTTGTPIAVVVANEDARSADYETMVGAFRPSHADYTYQVKYGHRAWPGGGRASARETIGRVAAGAIARKVLALWYGVEVVGYVVSIGEVDAAVDPETVRAEDVEATPVRCPDPAAAPRMIEAIEAVRKAGDSLGGVVEVVARNVPPGLGDPVFGKLEADLAAAMLSIPACKGFESGSGFAGARRTGSRNNDPFCTDDSGRIRTRTNHSGGIQGGISNGMPIVVRAAFKPTATILADQETVDVHGEPAVLAGRGRHDPCVLPRAVPICEAMAALVLVDHGLAHRAQCGP